ncbi:hypothetical protein [Bradyrhizobium sp. DN5]|uniref:DUF6998 domain-containing protein n=1 Tax=Bradyrhizobium sp. DN5 TaxID=3056950 RepID=UPI003523AE95
MPHRHASFPTLALKLTIRCPPGDVSALDGLACPLRPPVIYSKPQHLIALQLVGRREVVEVFNGPGEIAWKCASVKPSKNGQHSTAMGRLRALDVELASHERARY